ncbi:phytoene/squalene synthase family protein [Xylanimonas oleitrophica]|uniref:phytoene/squalene synthase family protein n=1 Tax=Xylanimonas oleitrophica TaxID=2607479 RepID=UPI00123709F0|nr:squalene/phytoene synthase family protein [Xylanimonas oleitrophica]
MSLIQHRATAVTPAQRYDAVAAEGARLVIRRYSTSFGIACRLLHEPVRTHVRNVYALVRIADELVDAPRPGATDDDRRALLDALETETLAAMDRGHSANLVVHAFARTAVECRIEPGLVVPFFASMRTDLERHVHDRESFQAYVYGSAEVVGLMCLRAFLRDEPDPAGSYALLAPGARRLGAAFQKLNFLRDLAADHDDLGRCYFPGIDPDHLTAAQRDELLADITEDLRAARVAVAGLPDGCRNAVALAHALFTELADRIGRAPVAQIRTERIRVPGPVKARVVARQLLRSRP